MVGELSRYKKVTVPSNTGMELQVAHNLGVIPKIILIHADFEPTEGQYATEGVFTPEVGACRFVSLTAEGNYGYNITVGSTGTTNATAYLNTNSILIRRQGSIRLFNPNAVYTVELYA